MIGFFKKIQWTYLLAVVSLIWIIPRVKDKLQNGEEFYGIAENQIRSYTRSGDVIIQSIKVKLGQQVNIGDTMMIFHPKNLFYKKEDLASQSRLLDIDKNQDQFKVQQRIQELENQKNLARSNYALKVEKLIIQKKIKDSLSKMVFDQLPSNTLYESEINRLKELLNLELTDLQQKISELEYTMKFYPDPIVEKHQSLRTEVQRINDQEKDLVLIADMDGVVGELDLQQGDPAEAYRSLIRIYTRHPTLVTTYISENYLGKVSMADTVMIQSLSNPGYRLSGKILSLGSRISSLPDRLKKIPEVKSWGREVQLEITPENELIQGEKVNVKFTPSSGQDH